MKIKENIQAIIDAFMISRKKYEEARKAIFDQRLKYSGEYLSELNRELEAEFEQVRWSADDKLNSVFQAAIDKIKSKRNRRTDFNESVATALSYINAMGDNISNEMAFDLIQPILGDYQTMKRFYLVLMDRLYTEDRLDLDGEKLDDYTVIVALLGYVDAVIMLEEMQVKYEDAFSKANSPSSIEILGTSQIVTDINISLALDTFAHYIMRDVDKYEEHIDAVEAVYAVNSGSVA